MHKNLIIVGVLFVALVVVVYSTTQKEGEEPDSITQTDESSATVDESTVEEAEADAPAATPSSATQPTPSRTPTQPATQASSLPYSATVIFDGRRFIPDEVTIIEGGTVRFVNQSVDTGMWIITDNHPTHDRYPIDDSSKCNGTAFDQCQAVAFGGSWSFTFTRFGGFGYHNEAAPKYNGQVSVLTVEEYNKRIQ